MKVLLVSLTDQLGGAEQVIKNIAHFYLKENKANVDIIFFSGKSIIDWDSLVGCNANCKIQYSDFNYIKFINYIKKVDYDFIFSSHIMLNATIGALRYFGFFKKSRFVVRESTIIFNRFSGMALWKYRMAYKLGYKKIDLIVTQTEDMKNELISNMPFINKRHKILTIPNPFVVPSCDLFNEALPKFSEKKCEYIIAAGRLIKVKGFDYLIEAFKKLKLIFPDLKLVILGEGPEREKLTSKINLLGLAGEVILFGFVNNVYPWFKNARLCVVSSIIEGFPNVLLQMMYSNCNVVSTICAGGIENISGVFKAKRIEDANSLLTAMIDCLNSANDINETKFNVELESRSIESFINKIETF